MYRLIVLVLVSLLVVWGRGDSPLAAEPQRGGATILIYHHFGDDRYPTTNVSIERFREQLAYLVENDYRVIPLAELVASLDQGAPLHPKTVVITVDDGYRTTYDAWSILREFGFPFTVFLYVEGLERGFSNYLTWEQVAEMAAAGVDFQDHSYSHHRLAHRPSGLDEDEYRRWISDDLQRGSDILQLRLGERPRFFAIPYGEYNQMVLDEARKLGYEAVFSQDAGSVGSDTPTWLIPREPILGEEWSGMEHFRKVLQRVDLPLAELTPGLEPLSENPPSRFGARLLYPERYREGSFGIYVSELGWQAARREGDWVYIENDAPLTRRTNRVMVSAREREGNQTALRFWLITLPLTSANR